MGKDGRSIPDDTLEVIRFRTIDAYKTGNSIKDISQIFGLHRGSISRWITKWKREGKKALKRKTATGRPTTINCKVYGKSIIKIVRRGASYYGYENDLWTCKRIKMAISKVLDIEVSIPTIWRNLKTLNLSCQKPERRALEQNPKEAKKWLNKNWPKIKKKALEEKALIFFEDESTIRLTPTVGRTWATVGKTPTIRVTGKRASLCVMSAISLDGKLYFYLPDKRVDSNIFIDFLRNLLTEYPKRKIFMVADKAPPHKSKKTCNFVKKSKHLEIFYLPSYSPELNPDEETWNHLKNHELSGHTAKNKDELEKKTIDAMNNIKENPKLVRFFFHKSNVT